VSDIHDIRGSQTGEVGDAGSQHPARFTSGLYLTLNPDPTIVHATDQSLRATLTGHEEIKGCGLFDVFPENP